MQLVRDPATIALIGKVARTLEAALFRSMKTDFLFVMELMDHQVQVVLNLAETDSPN